MQDLCEKCIFEEVAYLILNGDLPNKKELKKFKKKLEENRKITINLREIVRHMPKKAHPMDVAFVEASRHPLQIIQSVSLNSLLAKILSFLLKNP